MAKIPIVFPASTVAIPDRIPISEKSNVPLIRKAFHPSSLSAVLAGTFSVRQTREFSSSVRWGNVNGEDRSAFTPFP